MQVDLYNGCKMVVVVVVRPHRYAKRKMRPIATDVAWDVAWSVCLSCLSVGHKREPCNNR